VLLDRILECDALVVAFDAATPLNETPAQRRLIQIAGFESFRLQEMRFQAQL
jgi:hypothetical protein